MTVLNRKIPPDYHVIKHIDILSSHKEELSNRIPVHFIEGGNQEIVKMEFVFDAGNWYQHAPVVASMTNLMLNEGTHTFTAAEIAKKLDYYGAYIAFSTNQHTSSITLYSLTKYLDKILPTVQDIIQNSVFPPKEFSTILNNKKQEFITEQQKPKIIAKDCFYAQIYGRHHPYANLMTVSDFGKITPQMLRKFHINHYTCDSCRIILAGKMNNQAGKLLEKHFGQSAWPLGKASRPKVHHSFNPDAQQRKFIKKSDVIQSAIRIGRPMFHKNHPDYIGMQLLNMTLGGYFGSRLMSNIREDKGYTYGIGSLLVSYPQGGHFVIATEVGTDVCQPAVEQIYYELERLQKEPISDEELKLVKNYTIGEVLRDLDGPFSTADSLKDNLLYDLDNSYYLKYVRETQKISAEKIRELANRYLQKSDLFEVIVGKK